MIALINIGFFILLLAGSFYLWIKTRQIKQSVDVSEYLGAHSILQVSVPKNNDKTPLAAEQLFAALHGIYIEGASVQPQISFEIVAKNKQIVFYVHTPSNLRDFVASQLYAQYPNIEIKEIDLEQDYTVIEENQQIAATELALKKETVYPIKTFLNFEVDPLSAITGVLSSVGEQEQIWIQTIVRPIDDSWQEKGIEAIKKIKEPPKSLGFRQLIANEAKNMAVDLVKNVLTPQQNSEAPKKEEKKDELDGPTQQAIKGIEEKITKLGFETVIRILVAANDEYFAKAKLEQVVGAYKQYNAININSFTFRAITSDKEALKLFRERAFGSSDIILNITELASIYHFPSETVATPTIAWAGSKKGEPPPNLPIVGSVPADELTVFAQTNFRSEIRKFGIKKKDRRLHTYAIGKTGTGKSTMLENMIIDDIREGRGIAVVDPHGETINHILEFIPEERIGDVVYFNPADIEHPVGFNLLENVEAELKNVVASGVVGVFKRIFGESWGPRLEYILRNTILALLDYPGSTLLGVNRLLTDTAYRRIVIKEVKDPVIKDFFVSEYERYDPKFRNEAIAPIQNKVGQFLSSSTIRNIVGQPKSTVNIEQIMNEGKILLADFSVGKIGEDNSALLGSMMITKIQLAAMSRAHMKEEDRRDFYLYVDEFQNFATESFAVILSEARKYRLNLIMTNQYIAQLDESVSNAIFGNVGTMISFRVGAHDAEILKKEFEPIFDAYDLVNLDNYQIYLKMAIDGVTVPAFSAATLPPRTDPNGFTAQIIDHSRRAHTRERSEVEDYIYEWSKPVELNTSPAQNDSTSNKPEKLDKEQGIEDKKISEAGESAGEKTEDSAISPQDKLKDQEIEIIKDRFDRPWYAVTKKVGESSQEEVLAVSEKPEEEVIPYKEQSEDIISRDTEVGGGGESGESEQLITWENAEELGIDSKRLGQKKDNNQDDNFDDYQPIKEIN